MALAYRRGDVVSVTNPYAEDKPRSSVVLTDSRRPLHDDGELRYTIVLLTTAHDEFEAHDWTVRLDAHESTEPGHPPLTEDSLVEPWATYVVRHGHVLDGPHTVLTNEAMKPVARAYARMILA